MDPTPDVVIQQLLNLVLVVLGGIIENQNSDFFDPGQFRNLRNDIYARFGVLLGGIFQIFVHY